MIKRNVFKDDKEILRKVNGAVSDSLFGGKIWIYLLLFGFVVLVSLIVNAVKI